MKLVDEGKAESGQAIQQLLETLEKSKRQKGANPREILGASGRFGTLHWYFYEKVVSGKQWQNQKKIWLFRSLINRFQGQSISTALYQQCVLSRKMNRIINRF